MSNDDKITNNLTYTILKECISNIVISKFTDVIYLNTETLELTRLQSQINPILTHNSPIDLNEIVTFYNNTLEMDTAFQEFEDIISEFKDNCETIDSTIGLSSGLTLALLRPLLFKGTKV